MSVKDAHFARLDAAIDKNKMLGSILIRGVPKVKQNDGSSDDEGDEEDDDEDETREYSEAEMAELRHVLVGTKRDKMLKQMTKFASHLVDRMVVLQCSTLILETR